MAHAMTDCVENLLLGARQGVCAGCRFFCTSSGDWMELSQPIVLLSHGAISNFRQQVLHLGSMAHATSCYHLSEQFRKSPLNYLPVLLCGPSLLEAAEALPSARQQLPGTPTPKRSASQRLQVQHNECLADIPAEMSWWRRLKQA